MCSQVCFSNTFASEPRSRITWSISYSLIYAVNIISLPVCNACFPNFQTTRGSLDPAHLVISSYSPLAILLSCNSFMYVSRNVVSIEGSIPGSGWSLQPKVEASVRLFVSSMNIPFVRSKLKLAPCGPHIFLCLLPLILSRGRTTSVHHVYIWVFFAWLKRHHLYILSWRRLEYPFFAHPCDQHRTVYCFMIKLSTIRIGYPHRVGTIAGIVPWTSAIVTN